jgi:uncharacterized protein YyaL (SSP411 family)
MISSLRARRSIAVGVIAGLCALSSPEAAARAEMPRPANRLAGSTSPYLLQHQDNPVDWYPWGPEALARAKAEDRPIFLSIGYSACHWCHVMEHESFEDEATAALMNAHFISIKVDREERPDLDEVYMTAVQMLTGSGGWPMSVWLTPDLEPFYGGTYFPPDARHGRPSFRQVLQALAEAWRTDRESINAQARRVREAIAQHLAEGRAGEPAAAGADPVARAVQEMTERFDAVHGGFGHAPKFPPHRAILLLLSRWRETGDENLRRMATLTLDRMAQGGMYDQIGGGFHRYATDAAWQVPHFEKMLYDNALLADAYLEGWHATGNEDYRRIVREIFAWVRRDMLDTGGAFHSTLDADSDGHEGRFYVWKPPEVIDLLGSVEGPLVNDFYGITPAGNFEGGASIPHVDTPLEIFAERRRLVPAELRARLDAARATLLKARDKRVHPHRDDKILTAWNGLMIAAMARAARALEDSDLRDASAKAASFLLGRARGTDGLLRVSSRGERLSPDAFLDDQAFAIAGFLALHEAGAGDRWLTEAQALARATEKGFHDPAGGGYFFTLPGRADLIVRAKSATDGAIPSGNAVMASNLLALARATGDASWRRRADEVLSTWQGAMASMPGAFHSLLLALREAGGTATLAAPRITATPRSLPAAVPAGGRAMVEIVLEIPRGWHVQSAAPAQPGLIATRVALAPGPATLEAVEAPEGALRPLGFAARPLSVYEGTVTLRLTLGVPPATPAGPLVLSGDVLYQACNDRACLPPARAPFTVRLQVGGSPGERGTPAAP